MHIFKVPENKKLYLDLLLLADEEENMIDMYLQRGTMYALDDAGVKTICVVTDEDDGILEIKSLATVPEHQKQGYAKKMIEFIKDTYKNSYKILQVGTGDSPLTIPFYEKCGFVRSHSVKNFFTDNYSKPIFECGKQLIDMIYLRMEL